jgi:hypothetical protein
MAQTLLETVVLNGGATKLDTASPAGTNDKDAASTQVCL